MEETKEKQWNWKMILVFIVVFVVVSQILSDWDHFKDGLFSHF